MKDVPSPIRGKIDLEVLASNPDYHGLCSSCCNSLTCSYPREPGKPVLQCEEFDGDWPSPLKTVGTPFSFTLLPPATPRTAHFQGMNPNEFKGLCSICDDRETCLYPKPEGGVWHCEEYR